MKILVTGTNSGFGKHLQERFNSIFWNRDITDEQKSILKKDGVDVIIHCAFNSNKVVNSNNLYQYLSDNVLLTQELTTLSHKKFIYISTVDVYPKDNQEHIEDEVIDISQISGIYGISKLMSECVVRQICPNYLILRCSALLGKYSRKNSLVKMIEDEPAVVTVVDTSSFNYILHSDVADFIKQAMNKDFQGIYNLASSGNVTFREVANLLGKTVQFGSYEYEVGAVDNTKVTSVNLAFKKSSKEVVQEFIDQRRIDAHVI